jgi:hypothetical protein
VSCQGYFYETHGTIFHGKRSSPDLIVHVIACLAEGLGIRGGSPLLLRQGEQVWLVGVSSAVLDQGPQEGGLAVHAAAFIDRLEADAPH